jgi:hypothetical protein
MREAFEVMSAHPLLTLFLGFVIIACVTEIAHAIKTKK